MEVQIPNRGDQRNKKFDFSFIIIFSHFILSKLFKYDKVLDFLSLL